MSSFLSLSSIQFRFQKWAAFLLISGLYFRVEAQIVYRDITDGVPSAIDFNSDNSPEFSLFTEGTYVMYFGLGTSNNIHALGNANSGWDVPNCVPLNTVIGATGNWIGQGDCSMDGWGAGNSSITNNTDEYMAVRFNFVGNTSVHYGWVRFSRSSSGVYTYKDYAYNATPNASIKAGQTTVVANSEVLENALQIFHLSDHEELRVEFSDSRNEFRFSLMDAQGKSLKTGTLTAGTMSTASLPSGLYFLQVQGIENAQRRTFRFLKP